MFIHNEKNEQKKWIEKVTLLRNGVKTQQIIEKM